ncbi:MAG: type I restriction enzyme HsdR N-terminal domain-containing protein [Bacteroidia bacterium]
MAFSDKKYKELSEVLDMFSIKHTKNNFLIINVTTQVPAALRDDLAFILDNWDYQMSEEGVCEAVIFPILKEGWKNFADVFSFWSHKYIYWNDELKGAPDYMIAQKSSLGASVFKSPYIAVIEAKADNFSKAWGQCLTEMHTIQLLNGNPELPVFGIISNGETWKFGKLTQNEFIENRDFYNISDLDKLFSALITFLEDCKQVYIK